MKIRTYSGTNELRKQPENLVQQDINLFKHEFKKEIQDSYVIEIKNAYLSGKNLINLKNLRFYIEHTYMNRPPLKNIIKFILKFFRLRSRSIETIENGVWVINNKSENYFHWMTESLTRVLSFKKLNLELPILISEDFKNLEFVTKTLDLLRINYKIYENDRVFKVKNLLLTSHTAPAGNYNSNILFELHKNLNNGKKSNLRKRLWVSRKYSDRRYLINEDEIKPILDEYNIQVIYPEKMDYLEQVDLFRNAEFLGGVHGAALTNMLYMESNSKVLELRAINDAHNNCHYSLAVGLGNKFYYLICENDTDSNFIVDPRQFKNTLIEIFKN
ncbi:glycosyltransferase family 61 protein [Acidimicrobiaceae bacterium]|nr:glycosyltransferase family 61 protein [Acidimicrobiaceae bacterium]